LRIRKRPGIGALFVDPAHPAADDGQLGLAEQPVQAGLGGAGVGALGLVQPHAADEDAALGVAAHGQLGGVDQQLRKARLQQHQRLGRQHGRHARQLQRRPAGGVQHRHLAQLHARHPAAALHVDAADAQLYPQGL
jgi:hypothetical protein